MEATEKAIKGIDFKLLREQKLSLLELITGFEKMGTAKSKKTAAHLEGILNMIDAIQDAVVKDGIKTERQVFGKLS